MIVSWRFSRLGRHLERRMTRDGRGFASRRSFLWVSQKCARPHTNITLLQAIKQSTQRRLLLEEPKSQCACITSLGCLRPQQERQRALAAHRPRLLQATLPCSPRAAQGSHPAALSPPGAPQAVPAAAMLGPQPPLLPLVPPTPRALEKLGELGHCTEAAARVARDEAADCGRAAWLAAVLAVARRASRRQAS